MAMETSTRLRPLALSASALLAASAFAALLASPVTADLPASGAWIFPHERQSAVLAGTLGQFFYNGSSADDWINDAFFADADADGASVQVDFYNPTSGDLSNVILWVAVSDGDLFTQADFSGGTTGDMSVAADDLGGGTPTTGASLPDDVYPALYTSYGVGDLGTGAAGIITIDIEVTGDFAGGLVLRLDYTAKDANDDDISGPFEAGMTIYEWGDLPADGGENCGDASGFHLSGTLGQGSASSAGIDMQASLSLVADFEYEASDVTVTLTPSPGLTLLTVPGGSVSKNVGTLDVGAVGGQAGNFSKGNITLRALPLALDGDGFSLDLNATLSVCGEEIALGARPSVTVSLEPTGGADKASSWASDLADALRGQGHGRRAPDFNLTQYATFMQAIALHSAVFAYGPWNGTDPLGGDDEGWIDVSNLSDALSVLRKDGRANGNLKELQQELLALWLNVASGKVNLGSELSVAARGSHGDGDESHGHSRSQFAGVPEDVQEVVSGAETDLADYMDSLSNGTANSSGHGHGSGHGSDQGSGASARSLWAATVLCWLVNSGWLRVVS